MQTTRWQPNRLIAAIILILGLTVVLVYVSLSWGSNRTSGDDANNQPSNSRPGGTGGSTFVSYGLLYKNRISQRAKQAKLNGYDSAGPVQQQQQRQGGEWNSDKTTGNKRKCKNIDWYFSNVSTASRVPSGDAVQFGQLRSQKGLCAHVGDDNHVDVVDCSLAVTFERTSAGQLTAGDDGCLTVQTNSYVLVEACHHPNGNKTTGVNSNGLLRQQWTYLVDKQQLVNPWSSFCAMHVTDPRNSMTSKRQIVMAQNCSAKVLSQQMAFGNNRPEEFTRWSFVHV